MGFLVGVVRKVKLYVCMNYRNNILFITVN